MPPEDLTWRKGITGEHEPQKSRKHPELEPFTLLRMVRRVRPKNEDCLVFADPRVSLGTTHEEWSDLKGAPARQGPTTKGLKLLQ